MLVMFACSAYAQTMTIHLKNGNKIPVPLKDIEKITYESENTLSGKKAELVSDPVISDMVTLASMSQQYYRKPAALGGGANSFKGFYIPDGMKTSPNGTFSVKVEDESITLTGISKTLDKYNKPMKVLMVVDKNSIKRNNYCGIAPEYFVL